MSTEGNQLPPNLGPDDSLAYIQLAVVGTLCGLQMLLIVLRLPLRVFVLKSIGIDDYMISIASLMGVGVLICFIGETQNGMGRHTYYLTLEEQSIIAHWQFFHSIIVMLGISFVKLSVGFVLLRFVSSKWYRWFIVGMIAFLIAFTIACAGTLIWSCVPVRASWDFTLRPSATCFSIRTFTAIGLFNSSVNALTDLTFVALPIPVIIGLQANRRTKATLICILSLGIFACAASLVKIRYQVTALSDANATRYNLFNLWNAVELYVGIVAASLPTLRPLFKQLLDGSVSWSDWTASGGRSRRRSEPYGGGSAAAETGPGAEAKRASVLNRQSRRFRRVEGEEDGGYGDVEELREFEHGRKDRLDGVADKEAAEARWRVETYTRKDQDSDDSVIMRVPEGAIVKTMDFSVH